MLYHLFDRFRRTEVSAIVTDTVLLGVIVSILLCVFLAVKPGLDASRAASLAAKGESEQAMRLLRGLEGDGYPADRLESTKEAMIRGFLDAGRQTQAVSLLTELTDADTKAALEKDCAYAQAAIDYDSGDYASAAQTFYQLTDYRDGAARYADCRCALAVEAYLSGNEASARSLLLDTENAAERIAAAALKVTGSQSAADELLADGLFNADNLARMERTMAGLSEARRDMPVGRIAAGGAHTVALRSDGTVLATGDNTFGQCDVSAWTGITAVAAGAGHTVGLRSDGTVVSAGDNASGQCDTEGWTDITMIAAAAYDTVGLRSDGTVVACGLHADAVSGWHDAAFVTGGSYALACLSDKGTMLCSHKAARLDMGAVLYDLSVCGQVAAGVLYDGTLICSGEQAPDWTGMVSVTACESGLLGIDFQGQALRYDWRTGATEVLPVSGEAVEIESGGRHHVVLTSDGRVYAFGDNDRGQCGTDSWATR